MHVRNMGLILFVSVDKKMISPHNEWYNWKCSGMCTFFFKTSTWYCLCSITQLFRLFGIV